VFGPLELPAFLTLFLGVLPMLVLMTLVPAFLSLFLSVQLVNLPRQFVKTCEHVVETVVHLVLGVVMSLDHFTQLVRRVVGAGFLGFYSFYHHVVGHGMIVP